MKKMLIISLSLLLALGLAACTTPPPQSAGDTPPLSASPAPSPDGSESTTEPESQEPQTPPIPADAAMYRGTVSGTVSATSTEGDADKGTVQFTLTQAEGTDFGAPSLKFSFTADTRADFTPEDGQYLEVYYGRAPGAPLSTTEVHNALTAIKYHSAEMVNFNGTVKAINPHPDKPGQGTLVMASMPPLAEQSLANPASDPYIVHFNYDKEKTQFYLTFDEIKVGDKLNIFQSGAMTMSLPPQSFAIEVRPYAEPTS